MPRYRVEIDAGQRGSTVMKASCVEVALSRAIAWAQDADWSPDGDRCEVAVYALADRDDYLSTVVDIPPSGPTDEDAGLDEEDEDY